MTRYRNPVLAGCHPDPSVVRVDEWFYLVNGAFESPGIPLHRSRDLIHWEALGQVLTRDSQLPLRVPGGFAPNIRHHAGTFYVVSGHSGLGNFLVTTERPGGPWSEPVWIAAESGGHPSLLFGDDGMVYLTSSASTLGVLQCRIDVATGSPCTSPCVIWKATQGRRPEGQHLYWIAGRYYLLILEGDAEHGSRVMIARSRSPWGPFEACPRNPILCCAEREPRSTIQGIGHADLVEDAEGNWWLLFGAARTRKGHQQYSRRETFLAPVRWDAQGWPVVNDGQPIALEMYGHGLAG